MENDAKLALTYINYMSYPTCKMGDYENILYKKKWCKYMGRSIVHPHPTRHFTFEEYKEYAVEHPEMVEYFINQVSPPTKINVDRYELRGKNYSEPIYNL